MPTALTGTQPPATHMTHMCDLFIKWALKAGWTSQLTTNEESTKKSRPRRITMQIAYAPLAFLFVVLVIGDLGVNGKLDVRIIHLRVRLARF